jgi:multiple sugar transport system substrate-binding protein
MRTITAATAATCASLLAGLLGGCASTPQGPPRINLYNAPQENLQKIVDRCNGRARGRYRIVLNTLPRDANGQREQLVRRLAAADPGMDVLGIDVTWTAELAEAGWIREWTGTYAEEAGDGTIEKTLDTATWRNRLYAAPFHTNVQLLWYRSDLARRAPVTWTGLMVAADRLAAARRPHYTEVTGAQYEGVFAWFNSLVASRGGQILSPGGESVALGRPGLDALRTMRDFARSKAADPSLSNTQEDQARLAFEAGRAAFQVNWPFVWASLRDNAPDLAKKVKWAPYPATTGPGPGPSPLGGTNFAVSAFSQHDNEAYQAALCLRDRESQKIAAIEDGLPPTTQRVYSDPEVTKAYPMRDAILDALKTAAPRPKTPSYQNVSTTAAAILSPPSEIDPPPDLARLRTEITNALRSRGVLP